MKERIRQLAEQAGLPTALDYHQKRYEKFAELVRADAIAAEREACAKVCEQRDDEGECPDQWDWYSSDYAAAIRARSNT